MAETDDERFDASVRDLIRRARSDAPAAGSLTELRRTRRPHRVALLVAVALASAAIAAVTVVVRSDDVTQQIAPIAPPGSESVTPSILDTLSSQPTDSVAAEATSVPASLSLFCEAMSVLDSEHPESYIGSSAQVADLDSIIVVAPSEVRDDLVAFRDYVTSGAIRSTDPESNVIENWPKPVQTAIAAVEEFRVSNCSTTSESDTAAAATATPAPTFTATLPDTVPVDEPLVLSLSGVQGTSLDEGALSGAAMALSALPPGYRINYFSDGVSTAGSDLAWYATLLQMPDNPNAGELAPYVSVSISFVSGDAYRGFPDSNASAETTVGAFTGKWSTLGPDFPTFVAPIGGGASPADVWHLQRV